MQALQRVPQGNRLENLSSVVFECEPQSQEELGDADYSW
jgi:hypothetical protein